MAELAEVISAATGRTVTYTDLPPEQYQAVLVAAGLPEAMAAMVADGDRGVAAGELLVEGEGLKRLLGRAPTPRARPCAADRPRQRSRCSRRRLEVLGLASGGRRPLPGWRRRPGGTDRRGPAVHRRWRNDRPPRTPPPSRRSRTSSAPHRRHRTGLMCPPGVRRGPAGPPPCRRAPGGGRGGVGAWPDRAAAPRRPG